MNPPWMPYKFSELTLEEQESYTINLGLRLLEHRYRYYELDNPIIEDFLYDQMERLYEYLCSSLNIDNVLKDMVGWDGEDKNAILAKERVDSYIETYKGKKL